MKEDDNDKIKSLPKGSLLEALVLALILSFIILALYFTKS